MFRLFVSDGVLCEESNYFILFISRECILLMDNITLSMTEEMVRIPREVWLNCEKFIKNASDRIEELEKEIAKREEDFNARLVAVYREIANHISEKSY